MNKTNQSQNSTSSVIQPIQLTQAGYDEIIKELEELKAKHQPAVDRVATARSYGDLSENAEYHAAKEDLALLVSRIEELESVLAQAKVIRHQSSKSKIKLGSSVVLSHKGKKIKYQLVTAWEADPAQHKISIDSPLGKALLDKKIDQEFTIQVPAGEQKYTVESID